MAKISTGSGLALHSEADWLAAVKTALGGKAFDSLTTKDVDGIIREALYTDASHKTSDTSAGLPGLAPFTRGSQAVSDKYLPWHIAQRVVIGRGAGDNEHILTDLAGGVSALLLDFSATKSISADELDALLAGVMLDIAPVVLTPAACGADGIVAFLDLLARRHEDVEAISGHLNFDPFAVALAANQPVSLQGIEALVARAAGLPRLGLMTASGAAFHNEGAAPTDELAYMLAALTQSLRLLEAQGLAPEDALPRINLTLSADTDFFMTIAKIRSARQLFHMVAKNIGCAHIAPTIHCETSQRAYSRLDPWVNILRATVSTLAAGIAGAELISVAPCSATSDSDNTLTRRIARNTQIILQEESHIAHVSDAAGGSWYVEALTQQLTEQAWAMFRSIEAAGGLTEQINDGSVRAQLDARCRDYEALVETRELALVGVSEFPNLDEAPLPAPATPQSGYRHADKFEALRDIAERAKPKVYLACLGEAAAFTPRANFAANTYATGGMHAVTGAGGSDIAAIAQEFADSGAKIAVICGTDNDYEAHAGELAEALRAAGVLHLALVGRPRDFAAIDDYCFAGGPTLSFVQQVLARLGLEADA